MIINIHSDHILRGLRRPGETVYRIPHGGMFEFVSGANFFGEIVEWCGYAVATWSLPTFAFAFFTVCSIGPRAYHHHRLDYCKGVFTGLSKKSIRQLQLVQNAAARVLTNTKRVEHITPVLKSLHWLPVCLVRYEASRP
ncbi:3-oxo-5-alpha-steroid 4-dehydrogenase 2-like, partial [Epinephelus moara]|uniref:3-oxo-5-alpha-steroid 4-dehydrogenase 2-like n=1 Tax=Epinephelus moara TaxID=300413 RepID=UPI00214DF45F